MMATQTVINITPSGQPPSYESTRPEAPPPSYESLYGRVREAKRSSAGCSGFVTSVLALLIGTVGFVILIIVTLVIPVAMIAIGSKYVYACPVQPYIPIYLIVGGVFGVLQNFGSLRCRQEESKKEEGGCFSLVGLFQIAWFIAGSVWVYGTSASYDENDGDKYCNRTVYLFAFGIITFSYCVIVLVVGFMCCLGACYACIPEDDDDE